VAIPFQKHIRRAINRSSNNRAVGTFLAYIRDLTDASECGAGAVVKFSECLQRRMPVDPSRKSLQ